MLKFKARYRNGIIEPLEKVEIKEDSEITLALLEPLELDPDGLIRNFGGWKDTVDCDELIKNIYSTLRE